MTYKTRHQLASVQLDHRLASLRGAGTFARPHRGWVRAIRDALGMTAAQLAKRIGVSQPRVAALEKGEVEGTLTLRTLREAAQAMDCTLVYALLPNRPIEEMLKARARQQADIQFTRTHHTMTLENQAVDASTHETLRQRLIDELLRGSPRRLWDDE